MKSYTYSQAREQFAAVLDEAKRYGAVEIRRRDGGVFHIVPAPDTRSSPLDVPGVKLPVSSKEWVEVVRQMRER
jgi:antitoxin (DNA-binding transcriptional repressor) of toxin-antitoxin stability system